MYATGARVSIVGWGNMLQAGRSPVRVPDEVDIFNVRNLSSRTMALGSTQPLTETSTRNLPGSKKRPARKADKLAAIYEPNVWNCESLNLCRKPKGLDGLYRGKFTLMYATYIKNRLTL
jgi:hypothetical protein